MVISGIFLFIAFLLAVALLTYSPEQPAWRHNAGTVTSNWLGSMGAWFSDLSFSLIGKISYLLPLSLAAFFVHAWREKTVDKELLSWRLFMLVTAILSGCVLWAKHDATVINTMAQTGGGAVGAWLVIGLEHSINSVPVIMGFAAIIFITSISLIFNIPWGRIADWIGAGLSALFSNLLISKKALSADGDTVAGAFADADEAQAQGYATSNYSNAQQGQANPNAPQTAPETQAAYDPNACADPTLIAAPDTDKPSLAERAKAALAGAGGGLAAATKGLSGVLGKFGTKQSPSQQPANAAGVQQPPRITVYEDDERSAEAAAREYLQQQQLTEAQAAQMRAEAAAQNAQAQQMAQAPSNEAKMQFDFADGHPATAGQGAGYDAGYSAGQTQQPARTPAGQSAANQPHAGARAEPNFFDFSQANADTQPAQGQQPNAQATQAAYHGTQPSAQPTAQPHQQPAAPTAIATESYTGVQHQAETYNGIQSEYAPQAAAENTTRQADTENFISTLTRSYASETQTNEASGIADSKLDMTEVHRENLHNSVNTLSRATMPTSRPAVRARTTSPDSIPAAKPHHASEHSTAQTATQTVTADHNSAANPAASVATAASQSATAFATSPSAATSATQSAYEPRAQTAPAQTHSRAQAPRVEPSAIPDAQPHRAHKPAVAPEPVQPVAEPASTPVSAPVATPIAAQPATAQPVAQPTQAPQMSAITAEPAPETVTSQVAAPQPQPSAPTNASTAAADDGLVTQTVVTPGMASSAQETRVSPQVTTHSAPVALAPDSTPAPAAASAASNATIAKAYDKSEEQVSVKKIEAARPYALPSVQLLDNPPPQTNAYTEDVLADMAGVLESTLKQFNIDAVVMHVSPGPVITRFELDLAPGIQAKKITNLSVDLARALAVSRVRVEEVIPGSSYVGLEVPNKQRQVVYFKDVVCSRAFSESTSPLTISLGSDTSGRPQVMDLMKMPHALVAGTTGSGKSVCINVMLLSMLYKASPKDLRLILVDPKMLEMSMYEDIPHLLTPVITDMNEAENALTWAVAEMERRYQLMAALKVRKIDAFNATVEAAIADGTPIKDPLWEPDEQVGYTHHPTLERLPFIVIVIDELADMMMVVGKQVEQLIARLTQKARAAGIHVVLATQRPSTDVLTGLIKANVPTRIAFQVSSGTDSRVIIDTVGAEKLLGHGDMLFVPPGASHPQRLHGAFVGDAETDRITDYLRSTGEPDYLPGLTGKQDPETLGAFGAAEASEAKHELDPLYDDAVAVVRETGKASISSVQRHLRIGYNRAARMIEDMQNQGVVSEPVNGVRKVL